MTWKEPDLPALRELESTIVQIWSSRPEMNDYTVGRAYEAACQHYRARLRGRESKPPALNGLDLDTFNAVREVCEKLLEYLRELARSVERHTQLGGRCGYLEFIRSFIP